jgi:RNA polymerase sigma factor (sigma-70 family)
MIMDDASIWNSFLAGDSLAYEYIYRQHVQKLFLFGTTLTKDEELVKDCIQDVFVRLLEKRQTLGRTDNIRMYLLTALRHTILNALRKQKTGHTYHHSLEKEEPADDDTILEKMIRHEDELEKTELLNYLWAALTHRQKEIVYCRFVEGLGLEEISKRLHIDYHSVANVIQRALKKMRAFYHKK